ncbi:hypothetical protein EJK15_27900 [Nonomuraea basaltis]|nr:hypothetical protein EJK15_27900 [Nonomuraea basaltis]
MHPPDKQNGPGSTTSQGRNESKADQTEAFSSVTVQPGADKRKPQQLPIVLSATAYPAGYGQVTILIVLDTECACGDWHSHRLRSESIPSLLNRKARCGAKYELALHAPRVRRARRAAA